MKQLTIAMVQQNSIKENQLENTRSGLEYITEAKRKGADIVLFPECWIRSYSFPESARELMLQGAELILVTNDCKSMRPRLQELSTRAMENMVGIAMANPPGENGGCSCAFNPMVWDLDGNVIENSITIADEMTKGIFYAKFNMEEMREYRNREDIGKHRKVKAYKNQLRIP